MNGTTAEPERFPHQNSGLLLSAVENLATLAVATRIPEKGGKKRYRFAHAQRANPEATVLKGSLTFPHSESGTAGCLLMSYPGPEQLN